MLEQITGRKEISASMHLGISAMDGPILTKSGGIVK
jgi:hypothetical protein